MIWILLMLLIGVLLSAFFSGSETGFYRATRVKLVIAAIQGDPIARGQLWLANNPAMFVGTTLIGNNLANYITSLAIVLGVSQVIGESAMAEFIAPIALAPLLFVYGELLPKNLFYHAPNALLRRTGPLFLLFTLLFLPVSLVLWVLGLGLEKLVGRAPQRVQLALARSELAGVFEEGHEAGVLSQPQRQFAQSLFATANQPISSICTPAARVPTLPLGCPVDDAIRLARRQRSATIVIEAGGTRRHEWIGYVRVVDLRLQTSKTVDEIQPLPTVSIFETRIEALIQLQNDRALIARAVDRQGNTAGLLIHNRLIEPLFRPR